MLLHAISHSQGGGRCNDVFEMMPKFALLLEHTREIDAHIATLCTLNTWHLYAGYVSIVNNTMMPRIMIDLMMNSIIMSLNWTLDSLVPLSGWYVIKIVFVK